MFIVIIVLLSYILPVILMGGLLLFDESGYQRGDNYWKASTLYEYVKKKKLKPFKIPLAALNLSIVYKQFDNYNLDDIIYHVKGLITAI